MSPRTRLLFLWVTSLVWAGYMIFMAGFYHSSIFDPWLFVWSVFLFGLGPLLVIRAGLGTYRMIREGEWRLPPLIVYAFISVLVPSLSFGFGAVADCLRPRLFLAVSEENEALAREAMNSNPEGQTFRLSGFRYPYCRLWAVPAWHKNGVMWVLLPGSPGAKDRIIYDPRREHARELEHVGGPWYLDRATH